MKVLLISANQLIEPYPVYPIGLDYVAAALTPAHEVRVLDRNHSADGDLDTQIRSFAPEVVGLSLRNIDNTDISNPLGYLADYKALIDLVRNATTAPVVLGGSGFTIFPRETMDHLKADYGIIGEGERLPQLLAALSNGTDPGAIAGVITARDNNIPTQPWQGEFIRRFDAGSPHLQFYLQHSGMLNLQTKRGCPFHCIYCTYPNIEGRRMRLIEPDAIGRTAAQLQAAGAKYLFITDSAFNADIEHSMAVARAIKQAKITIPWGAFFAPLRTPSDYFRTMADSGLRHVEFGTESLSDPVLKAYGKPFRKAEVQEAHDQAKAAGLHVAHYFLFGGPGETADTLTETLTGMEELKQTVFFLFCGMRIYPDTALYQVALNQGQCHATESIVEPVYYQSPAIDNDTVMAKITAAANGRDNWVIGAGDERMAAIMNRMYHRGFTGPLWEYLCR